MTIKTPLKWVGSKVRLMPQLRDHLPEGKRLVEPFAGSCAVMMNTDYDEYLIADLNPDLVNLYKAMAYHTDAFLVELETLFSAGALGEQESRAIFIMPSGTRSICPERHMELKALKPLPVSCT